ncbi:AAA family ATPase [Halorarius litoreus]|uniref:AAA family ATPase n=1 Tax=Halorarius litoreus TaxID=2962676 RepID=UPI0020CB8058|nr:MoxR family ATPase [Halorarius litoreus]
MSSPAELYDAVRDEAGTVLIGNEDIIEGLTVSLLTGGHVLLEGVPGVAKTTMANLFARTTGLEYQRIQMTPDILPADITGTNVYREQLGEFELRKGPVFANTVVADEINRATPKAQAALLEAMQERRVTIEGQTLALPEPFIVIATQNPIEMEGTFSLPEAQRDRFQLKLTVDLPNREDERALFDRFNSDPGLDADRATQVTTPEDIVEAQDAVAEVYLDERVREYILDIVEATRESPDILHGASPRATLAFLNAGKARAAIEGRDYVIPDDIKSLAQPVLRHRLVLTTDAQLADETTGEVIDDVLGAVSAPGAEEVSAAALD